MSETNLFALPLLQSSTEISLVGFIATATPLQDMAYISSIATICIFAIAAIFALQKSLKRPKEVTSLYRTFGTFLMVLTAHAFISNRILYDYLHGEIEEISFVYRLGGWIVLAPLLTWMRALFLGYGKTHNGIRPDVSALIAILAFILLAFSQSGQVPANSALLLVLLGISAYVVLFARAAGYRKFILANKTNPVLLTNPGLNITWIGCTIIPAFLPIIGLLKLFGLGQETAFFSITLIEFFTVCAIFIGLLKGDVPKMEKAPIKEIAKNSIEKAKSINLPPPPRQIIHKPPLRIQPTHFSSSSKITSSSLFIGSQMMRHAPDVPVQPAIQSQQPLTPAVQSAKPSVQPAFQSQKPSASAKTTLTSSPSAESMMHAMFSNLQKSSTKPHKQSSPLPSQETPSKVSGSFKSLLADETVPSEASTPSSLKKPQPSSIPTTTTEPMMDDPFGELPAAKPTKKPDPITPPSTVQASAIKSGNAPLESTTSKVEPPLPSQESTPEWDSIGIKAPPKPKRRFD